MTQTFKNILIIKPSALGDVILAMPTLSALRGGLPDAKITWLIRPEFAAILRDHPMLDSTMLFARATLGDMKHPLKAADALKSLIHQLAQARFDAVIDLQGLLRTALMGRVTGATRRFGMDDCREGARLFYTDIVNTQQGGHVVDHYLDVARAAGAAQQQVDFAMHISQKARDSAAKLINAHTQNPYAVFICGSAHSDKMWPIERFAVLAEKVRQKYGLAIVAPGSKSEKTIVSQLVRKSRAEIIDLAGQTSLDQLAAVIDGAQLVVGNDTGPCHIAAALGKPMVVIYGRANPLRLYPYNRPQCVAAIEPYSRADKRNSKDPKYDVKKVTFDMVWQKITQQMEKPD